MAQVEEKAAKGKVRKKPKDVEITGISVNKSQDMKFWKEQSANEIRAQIKLRYPDKFQKEWPFKFKPDLLEIIESLIKNKKW